MPELDAAFAALGDPVRRAMVARLARGDATVGELAEPFDLTQQAISHHVSVLRRCGLVEQRRDGTRRPCRLRPDRLAELGSWIDDQRRAWDDRLNALEQHLGTDPLGAAGRGEEGAGREEEGVGRGEEDASRGEEDAGRGEEDAGRGEQDAGRAGPGSDTKGGALQPRDAGQSGEADTPKTAESSR
jgi:DNA-binding transcriptional ArsR family regulator